MQERDRRSAPVIDEEVHEAILIEITRQTSHGRHRVRVKWQGRGKERERLIARASLRQCRDDHLVRPRIHVAAVVREGISIEIIQRDRGTHC